MVIHNEPSLYFAEALDLVGLWKITVDVHFATKCIYAHTFRQQLVEALGLDKDLFG